MEIEVFLCGLKEWVLEKYRIVGSAFFLGSSEHCSEGEDELTEVHCCSFCILSQL